MSFKFKSLVIAGLSALALSACGNISKVTPEGTTDEPVWPNVDRVGMNNKQGTFPNLESLKEVKAGMTKDQLYYLLGRPHFGEGFVAVREWDYVFHFHTPGQGTNDVTTCQFKVLYDKDRLTRQFYWNPVDPVDGVCPPGQQGPQTYTVEADALFAFDSYNLSPAGQQRLTEIANELRGFAELNAITVEGHTDRIGSDAYNQRLSQNRANVVRNYLVQQGVPSHLITAQGYGKTRPVKSCDGVGRGELIACLAPNRRVEVRVDGHGIRQ